MRDTFRRVWNWAFHEVFGAFRPLPFTDEDAQALERADQRHQELEAGLMAIGKLTSALTPIHRERW